MGFRPGVTVAVIDSGVNPTNPDLKGRILQGRDLAPDQPGDEHTDYDGHGTGTAGLIAGTGAYGGGNGAFGLAPGAKILPIRLPKSGGVNQAEGAKRFNETASKAIRYATDAGAQVINISQASPTGSSQLTSAVEYALGKGNLIFAGVGNDGDTTNEVVYPAATPGVVGVGAVGKELHKTAESQYGPQVDMAAPGDDMVHACGDETGLCVSHGTSDATALASTGAALIWSKHPTWTNNQVLRVMLNTIGAPTDGTKRNDSIGYGIVRPRIALQTPGDPGPADVYPLPDLAAAASTSPSPRFSETADAGTPAKDDDAAATAPSEEKDSLLWIALAIAVLLATGLMLAIVVRRRRARVVTPPTPVSVTGQYPYIAEGFGPPHPYTPGSATPPERGKGGSL
ncbi:type VII secretion-associated serine protease mycosin [Streptomyces bobili]|uniref:type VII secretion-associated serine protease mycosin n=1 Tax=Streptomyces bobili TaxID=67280 RepID=UPI00339FABBB